jgi:cation:H+ antiporter
MLDILLWAIILAVSLFVLIKASQYFTESAEKIGLFFGMPIFIVGVTIVAVGTSLPELISSIFAVLENSSEIVVGNVVGSNIANIFLILGITAIIGKRLKITYEILHVDLPILVASAFLLTVVIWDGTVTLPEAVLLILGIIVYFSYTLSLKAKHKDIRVITGENSEKIIKKGLDGKIIFILVVSTFFIYAGAKYTVESVINLSEILNLGKEIIAVSAVALGTSLPELAVSLTALRKGKPEIAVGNVLGSNIFNTFVVMGAPAFFGALVVPSSILAFSLPIMLMATLLFLFITQAKVVTKWEGYMLVLFYVFFIGKLFGFI